MPAHRPLRDLRRALDAYDKASAVDDDAAYTAARAVAEAARALCPESTLTGAGDTIPDDGAYVVDVTRGHTPIGDARVAWRLTDGTIVEVGLASGLDPRGDRPALRIRAQGYDGGSLIVRPASADTAYVEVETNTTTARAVAAGLLADLAPRLDDAARVAEEVVDAYLDPALGRARRGAIAVERSVERAAAEARDAERIARVRFPIETGRDPDDPDRCASWCHLDRHDGPCMPDLAEHRLSPGGRIALDLMRRHHERDGRGVYSSNRTQSSFVAAPTLDALITRGLAAPYEHAAGEYRLTPLGHGIIRALAEAES